VKAQALAISVCLAVLLAGCGDKPKKTVEVSPGVVTELEEPAEPGTGFVAGIVGDDAIYPLVGATVRLMGTDKSTTTDFRGNFLIQDVEPGIYIVEASKLDHLSQQATADVTAGKVAKVALLLQKIPTTLPYHRTEPHEGFVQAHGVPFLGFNTNTSFVVDLDESAIVDVIVESAWEGTFVPANHPAPLKYSVVTWPKLDNIASGTSADPLYLRIDGRIIPPHARWIEVRIEPNEPDLVAYQATSKDYVTVFYNEPAKEGWSFLAGDT
jgi:hypothetical protein